MAKKLCPSALWNTIKLGFILGLLISGESTIESALQATSIAQFLEVLGACIGTVLGCGILAAIIVILCGVYKNWHTIKDTKKISIKSIIDTLVDED